MFLNSLMLFGLAAVSVPIIIHLLNKRKFERVVWAAMRFLQVSVEQNQRRIRVEDLILLVLRCLLLALLALALARPVIRAVTSGLFGQAGVTSVILLDNSYSMGAVDGANTRFEQAKTAADQAIGSLPAGSSVAVYYAADAAEGVIPEPTFDLNLARKTIREAKLSDRGSNLYPAVRKAVETLQGRPGLRKEVVLVTDGQGQAWKQYQEIRKTLDDAKADVHSHVLLIGSTGEQRLSQNLGVSDLRLASGAAVVSQPLHFEVRVTNYGNADRRDVRVALKVDEETTPTDEGTIDSIPPGGSRSLALFAKLPKEGAHSITASLPADYLPADDARTVVVRAVSQVKVLVVDGQPGRDPRDSETFFLRNALLPIAAGKADEFHHKVTVIPSTELETTKFDPYDVVFLANVTDVSPATLDAFAGYVGRGGGLVIFPGGNVNLNFYNDQLGKAYQFLPAQLSDAHGDPEKEEDAFHLQGSNFEHPIASLWNDRAAGSPAGANFYRAFDLIPAKADASAPKPAANLPEIGSPRVVMSFADGKPAVIERAWGRGRVVLFASTADTDWNDLPARPNVWVPLVHRIVGAVVGRQDEALNVRVGEKFVLHPDARTMGREAMIARPDDKAATAARRVDSVDGTPTLTYDDTSAAGAYDVKINGTGAGDEAVALKFAAQADPAESSLEPITADQEADLMTVAGVLRAGPDVSIEAALQKQRVGTELWMPLAIAALCIAAAETILAHWFSRAK